MDARALHDLTQLALRDTRLAQDAALRTRAEAIDTFFAVYPDEERRRREEAESAEAELGRRRDEVADAERALAATHDDAGRERARSALARANDHVSVAAAALE